AHCAAWVCGIRHWQVRFDGNQVHPGALITFNMHAVDQGAIGNQYTCIIQSATTRLQSDDPAVAADPYRVVTGHAQKIGMFFKMERATDNDLAGRAICYPEFASNEAARVDMYVVVYQLVKRVLMQGSL